MSNTSTAPQPPVKVPAVEARPDPNPYYPTALAEAEKRWLGIRRAPSDKRAEMIATRSPAPADLAASKEAQPRPPNIAGLALSGGGIRSATFCLGVLQSLAARGLLKKVDYLSTVSGGGYIGSFLGAWISRPRFATRTDGEGKQTKTEKFDGVEEVERQLNRDADPFRFLRENGRFLAPNGAGDAWGAMIAHVRSWLSILLVIGVLALAILMFGESLKLLLLQTPTGFGLDEPGPTRVGDITIRWSIFLGVARWILLYGALPLAAGYWIAYPIARGPAPVFRFLATSWLYLVGALLVGRGLPDVVQDHPWEFLLVLTLTLEWCLWADFRQRLHARTQSGKAKQRWPGYIGAGLFLAALASLVYFVGALIFGYRVPHFIAIWPWRSLAFVGAAAIWHGSREFLLVAAPPGEIPAGLRQMASRRAAEGLEADFGAARSALHSGLCNVVAVALGIAVFGLVDSVAQTLVHEKTAIGKWLWTLCSPAALVALLQSVLPNLLAKDTSEEKSSSFWLEAALWLGAVILFAVTWVGLATAARWWATTLLGVNATEIFSAAPWWEITATSAILFFVSYCLGRRIEFVNLSSHHQLYSARLTRAYLGASNPLRKDNWQLTETVTGDQIEYAEYRPQARGGPLHLINVTVNETVSGISNIEQRDRKGFSLAVGPTGLSVGRRDNALFTDERSPENPRLARVLAIGDDDPEQPNGKRFHAFGVRPYKKFYLWGERDPEGVSVEMPPLGAWVGMSGAAFTTGLGARTSLAKSLLLGFFNVRLGYWWNSGVAPGRRNGLKYRTKGQVLASLLSRMLPVQVAFLEEMLARFHGAARMHWYISDGGHFENTACYELLRRRVPFIICCDCGCDPAYTYEDVGNLVRKARIDFGARIRFLNQTQIENVLSPAAQRVIGPLSALAPTSAGTPKLSRRHAALARVMYPDADGNYSEASATSLLLLIKPTLTTNVSRDVLQYAADNPPFPQQTTLDQFFDEAQWESYRQLGFEIGESLFSLDDLAPANEAGWKPAGMPLVPTPPPPPAPPPSPAGPKPAPPTYEGLLRIVLRHCTLQSDYEDAESGGRKP